MEWNADDGLRALARMRRRASCRSFDDREIPDGLLDEILRTGLCAASGGNLQPYSIIVIKDAAARERLAETCGGQRFIAQAPANLLFVLDWYKMGVFAELENAPFTCGDSYMHFLIALEDVMCAAQTIETAAWLCGLGSCYVGTTNHAGARLIEDYNLPERTYPVLLLSLGYPRGEQRVADKLPYGFMVFDDKYPELDTDAVEAAFRAKYGDRAMKLPEDGGHRNELLERFREALLTTYAPEKADAIVRRASADGSISETQRRFGLHYHAAEMRMLGREIIKMMEDNGLTFFSK